MRPVSYYAKKYGIPLGLANALVGQESGGRANAVSPKGATGLTQVMPETARGLGVNPARLKNPDVALDTGFKYLRMQYDHFKHWELALAAYNAGPNAVIHYGGIPPYAETQHYVQNIMARAGALKVPPALPSGPGSAAPTPEVELPKLATLDTEDATAAWADRQLARMAAGKPYNALAGLNDLVKSLAASPAPLPSSAAMAAPEIQTGRSNNPHVQTALGLVKHALGVPYVWGGESTKGFDCSGLLQYVWGKAGVSIPRTSQAQWKAGRPIKAGQLAVGDAVFFHGGPGGPGHVAFYIGGGRVIAAPHTGDVVKVQRISDIGTPVGYRRFV